MSILQSIPLFFYELTIKVLLSKNHCKTFILYILNHQPFFQPFNRRPSTENNSDQRNFNCRQNLFIVITAEVSVCTARKAIIRDDWNSGYVWYHRNTVCFGRQRLVQIFHDCKLFEKEVLKLIFSIMESVNQPWTIDIWIT